MTSANRSSEPIAYEDADALRRLSGLADAFLIGERPIARRVDDSVARDGAFGPVILRRSRGYAPGAVATLPVERPILAVGADLKNTVTLVVDGQAFVSQHIGDLDHFEALRIFRADHSRPGCDVRGGLGRAAGGPRPASAICIHRARACACRAARNSPCSIIARTSPPSWPSARPGSERVIGVSFDGTGYGDDGAIWGGEFFTGSLREGFERAMHLRTAALAGGDAAARYPVQCAAGFLVADRRSADARRCAVPFPRSLSAGAAVDRARRADVRDHLHGPAVRHLRGAARVHQRNHFRRPSRDLAGATGANGGATPVRIRSPSTARRWIFARCWPPWPRIACAAADASEIARAFHAGVAQGLCDAVALLCEAHAHRYRRVFGRRLSERSPAGRDQDPAAPERLRIWTNSAVPPNDGGISLGQAALAAFQDPAFQEDPFPCMSSPSP